MLLATTRRAAEEQVKARTPLYSFWLTKVDIYKNPCNLVQLRLLLPSTLLPPSLLGASLHAPSVRNPAVICRTPLAFGVSECTLRARTMVISSVYPLLNPSPLVISSTPHPPTPVSSFHFPPHPLFCSSFRLCAVLLTAGAPGSSGAGPGGAGAGPRDTKRQHAARLSLAQLLPKAKRRLASCLASCRSAWLLVGSRTTPTSRCNISNIDTPANCNSHSAQDSLVHLLQRKGSRARVYSASLLQSTRKQSTGCARACVVARA
jgi:hypothetical protein